MAILTKRKSRATRKAEAAALKHRAGLEAKLVAKESRRYLRRQARIDARALASQEKADRAKIKAFAAQEKAAKEGRFSPAKVRRYLAIARLLSPVLLPIVYRASTVVRAQLDQYRANRIGVSVDSLADYAGHGGRLSARIAGAERSLAEIITARPTDPETGAFVKTNNQRLAELTAAVLAAEKMPPARRKSAHLSIGDEIGGIEADILARLGVR